MIESRPTELLEELLQIFKGRIPEKHEFFATEGTPTRAQLYDFLKRYKEGILENRKELDLWKDFLDAYVFYAANRKANSLNLEEVRTNAGYDAYLASLSDLINNKGSAYVTDEQVNTVLAEIEAGTFDPTAAAIIYTHIRPGLVPNDWTFNNVCTISGDGQTVVLHRSYQTKLTISRDGGRSWAQKPSPSGIPTDISMSSDVSGAVLVIWGTGGTSIWISYNAGTTWTTVTTPAGFTPHITSTHVRVIDGGTDILMCRQGQFIGYRYNGTTWTQISDPFTTTGVPKVNSGVYCTLSSDGSTIFIGDNGQCYLSSDYGINWVRKAATLNSGDPYLHIGGANNEILVGLSSNGFAEVSTDYGDTWVSKFPISRLNTTRTYGIHTTDAGVIFSLSCIVADENLDYFDSFQYSLDYGDTWQLATVEGVPFWVPEATGADYIKAGNKNTSGVSMVQVPNKLLYRTGDGGLTWYVSSSIPGQGIS